ncbi:MAG: hypothetical protein FD149_1432 [Rhodospirillaceae bacterium]|nr:MAG: hypothetical protein FD149_1432 [Rhodospirillaceae bacterium]
MMALIMVVLILVVGVLVTGVVTFMQGGSVTQRHSLHLMNLRVALQALALLLLLTSALLLR